ncbi:CYTH and CHAD domain-containing protein [Mycolicibacterium brisbanense]|uniref:CHAD domain-containing protein n=1 Tax=Mycolicibacterium brisbanense TaxID=146020 RepID=A0A124E066_9MYCO|nr:CYTH and CHAD domain-containing protein [Mycolicibacterium brisbanense]MCV7156823.1 CYTH and CHAD domain-containing protein [Mycolicibacterium brisbanense]GAS89539.1 CHAD domain-containing protein [Mycolicibacterium brisbanense]
MEHDSATTLEPARHLEIERKFDVAESTVVPSFDGLTSITRVSRAPTAVLDAVYFDTPEHDLAAQRITLRRRTGGSDPGWHLKLPADVHTRTEIRMPLSAGDGVPADLRDIVLAIVRDHPLLPVAHINTTRTVDTLYGPDGNALAEFADDRVSASAGDADIHWREWELELSENTLADGDATEQTMARVADRLRQAGAVPAGHASKLARALGASAGRPEHAAGHGDSIHQAVAEHLQKLLEWDRAVRADAADSVHQMRVTIRTIRSLLQASPAAFGLGEDAPILDELQQLGAVLGTARDAEVLGERYARALDDLPEKLVRGPVRHRLVDGAHDRYQSGLQASLAAMRCDDYFRLLDQLEAVIAAEPLAPSRGTEKLAEATIADGYRSLRRRVRAAAAADVEHHDIALHRIRKSAKRLRYTAAATGQPKVAEAAKAIQTLLGDHQDSVVSRGHLIEQADVAHDAGEDTLTYGVLYHREVEIATRCEQDLTAALKMLAKAVRTAR